MKVESITSAVSSLALAFGEGASAEKTMSRPFGVALLFAGIDKKGPRYVYVFLITKYFDKHFFSYRSFFATFCLDKKCFLACGTVDLFL